MRLWQKGSLDYEYSIFKMGLPGIQHSAFLVTTPTNYYYFCSSVHYPGIYQSKHPDLNHTYFVTKKVHLKVSFLWFDFWGSCVTQVGLDLYLAKDDAPDSLYSRSSGLRLQVYPAATTPSYKCPIEQQITPYCSTTIRSLQLKVTLNPTK